MSTKNSDENRKIIFIGFLDIRNTKIVNRAQAIIDSVKNVIFVLFYYFLTKRVSFSCISAAE